MAEEHKEVKSDDQFVDKAVETNDRALFGLIGKKDEADKSHELIKPELETKVPVSESEETKSGLLEKLRPSNSSSNSSSEEEDKVKEEIRGGDKEERVISPVGKPQEEEHKGFLQKIKDKFAGNDEKPEVVVHPPTPTDTPTEQPEKKGIIERIKEKDFWQQ